MDKQHILNLIIGYAREIVPELGERSIGPNDRLADLGANSIDRAEIIALTMDALSMRIPRVELAGARNIGELAEVFHDKYRAQ